MILIFGCLFIKFHLWFFFFFLQLLFSAVPLHSMKLIILQDFELNIYNPKGSSTSKKVTCNSSLCAHRNQCFGAFSDCPYMVSYVSAETSTSGILVEDLLHLTIEDSHQELVEAYITFG